MIKCQSDKFQKNHLVIYRIVSKSSLPLKKRKRIFKVEKLLKGNLDSISSPSVKIQIMSGKVCLRRKGKTLLGIVSKTFCIQKFVDNTQQCFAFTEGSSYSNVDDMMEGHKIKSALPFKIFSTLTEACLENKWSFCTSVQCSRYEFVSFRSGLGVRM